MRLITMSLWGSDPVYTRGALENARLAPLIYPGWVLRVYCDRSTAVAEELRRLGCEVRPMTSRGAYHGAFWRFLPAGDPKLDAMIVRDTDSRLNSREAAAVDEWLKSGKGAHVMRDHPHHLNWPILAGMWGVRGGIVPDMPERIRQWHKWEQKLDDQYFLAHRVWPNVKDNCLQHATGISPFGGRPFPMHPPCESDYVGQVFDADNRKDTTR